MAGIVVVPSQGAGKLCFHLRNNTFESPSHWAASGYWAIMPGKGSFRTSLGLTSQAKRYGSLNQHETSVLKEAAKFLF